MGNNFWSCSLHLTVQTGHPRPTVFKKCWASCNNGVNVILQKYQKGGGRGERRHCNNSSFISKLICLFVICFFIFVCSFSVFVCSFFLLLHLREQLQYGWNIVLYCLFVLCLFARVDLLYKNFCARNEKFLKANGVGLLVVHFHMAINNYGATWNGFTNDSLKEGELHSCRRKEEIFYRQTCACTDTRKRNKTNK